MIFSPCTALAEDTGAFLPTKTDMLYILVMINFEQVITALEHGLDSKT